jgi:SAM-dependent methyltransferase
MSENFYDRVYYRKKNVPPRLLEKYARDKLREINFLNEITALRGPCRLLDLGCGNGNFIKNIPDPGVDAWGIDISRRATEAAKSRVAKPEQIIRAEAPPLPFENNFFDTVTAWGVIEHFPCLPDIIKEISRVARPDAAIFIMVPNIYYYKFIWDALRKGKEPVKHQEPENLLAFQEWKNLLEAGGLAVKKTLRHNKFNRSGLFPVIRDLFVPFYLSNHFIFICRNLKPAN